MFFKDFIIRFIVGSIIVGLGIAYFFVRFETGTDPMRGYYFYNAFPLLVGPITALLIGRKALRFGKRARNALRA